MPEPPREPRDLTWRQRVLALVLLAAALAAAGLAQAHYWLGHPERQDQFERALEHRDAALLWSVALAVVTAALCLWTRSWRLPGWPGRRAWVAVIAALVLVGGWLRFHRLDELPPGLWIDEALNGVQAWQIAERGWPRTALPEEDVRTGLGAGFVDVAALVFALAPPVDGIYAIRAVAAGLGACGVAAAAALAWVLFGPRVAVAATAWLAVSQYHLNFSRWGEMPIMSPLIESLACLALAIGLRGGRGWRAWVALPAAGIAIGAGLYTYQTYRTFLALAALTALPLAIRHRRRLAAQWPPLAAGLLLAAVVAAPMLRYAVTHSADFSERARGTLIPGRADWREQFAESVPRSLLAFQYVGDDNPRHNLPGAPLLSPVPAALAPLGLIVCLVRARHLAFALVPIWWLFALVPAVITLEAPHATRLLDGIVPLALMIGIAVDLACGVLQAALPARRVGLLLGGAAAALAGGTMAVQEYRMYFRDRERLPAFVDAFYPHESAPGRYLASRLPAATVYLDPGTYHSPTTQFVAWRYLNELPADVRMLRLLHDFPPRGPVVGDAVLLFSRDYLSLAGLLRALAPAAECEEIRDPLGRLDLAACRVPAAAVAALERRAAAGRLHSPFGLRARIDRDGDGRFDDETLLPFGFLDYVIDGEPFGRFARAEFDGFIDLPVAGEYLFRLHPDASRLEIDGREILAPAGAAAFGGANEGRAELAAGRRPIRITLTPGGAVPYFLWFLWQPPERDVELVPATALRPPLAGDPPPPPPGP